MRMTLWVGKPFSFVSHFDVSSSNRGCGLHVWCLKFSTCILLYLSLSDPSIGWLSASSKLPVRMKKRFLPSKSITHQISQMLSHRSWEQLQHPQWRSPMRATDPAFRATGHFRKGFYIEKRDKSYKGPRHRTQLACKVSIWCMRVCTLIDVSIYLCHSRLPSLSVQSSSPVMCLVCDSHFPGLCQMGVWHLG